MARVEIPFVIRDSDGNLVDATIEVYNRGTLDETEVYAAETGGSPISQPFATSGSTGRIDGWIEQDQSVDIVVSAEELITYTQPWETFRGDAEIESGKIADSAITSAKVADGAITPIKLDRAYVDETLVDAKGDLLVGDAADSLARLAVGTNGWILTADSAEATGVKWVSGVDGGIAATLIDAKGDLIAGSADNTPVRFAVGTNGLVLTADSGQTSGLAWTAMVPQSLIDAKGDLIVGDANDSTVRVGVGANGTVLTANSGQASGVAWTAITKTFRTSHTWAVQGEIKVPSGDTDYIPGFYVAEAGTQATSIIKARGRINSGTSVTVDLKKNGTNFLTGWVIDTTTTAGEENDFADEAVAEYDYIQVVVTAVAGTPKNMTVSLVLEHVT